MNRQKIRVEPESVVLIPHRRHFGNVAPITQALAATDGEILPPAVVRDRRTQEYVIIGGERRWLAAQRLPTNPAYVIVCDVWSDYLAWLTLDKAKEHPTHRSMPLPLTDIVALTGSLTHYLKPSRDDRMDSTLAEYFDAIDARISETRSVKRIKDGNNPESIQELADREWAEIAKGKASPSAAFQRIRRAENALAAPPADVRVQRGKLTNAVTVCTGLVDGLANFGDASHELTDDEVAQFVKRLGDGRRALDMVIRKLRERAS